MLKVFVPICLLILLAYGILYYWSKANIKNKKNIAIFLGSALLVALALTTYLVFN
jgi:hypothetical protein